MWARALPASPKRATSHSQPIKRASHAEPTAVEHMRIDHRGAHIAVPKQLLDRPNVVPRLEQMRSERMPQRMAACTLVHARRQDGIAHGILKHGLVKVVPSPLPGVRLSIDPRRRKHPLPWPLAARIWQLPAQGVWKLDPTRAVREVGVMLFAHALEMLTEWQKGPFRKKRPPILPPLAVAHEDLAPLEVELLHTKSCALQKPKPCAIEELCHERRHAIQSAKNRHDLALGQNDRNPVRPLRPSEVSDVRENNPQDVRIEEQNPRERLILRRCRNLLLAGQMTKERLDLVRAELGRMPASVKDDESPNPSRVSLGGPRAKPTHTNHVTNTVEESRGRHVLRYGKDGAIANGPNSTGTRPAPPSTDRWPLSMDTLEPRRASKGSS